MRDNALLSTFSQSTVSVSSAFLCQCLYLHCCFLLSPPAHRVYILSCQIARVSSQSCCLEILLSPVCQVSSIHLSKPFRFTSINIQVCQFAFAIENHIGNRLSPSPWSSLTYSLCEVISHVTHPDLAAAQTCHSGDPHQSRLTIQECQSTFAIENHIGNRESLSWVESHLSTFCVRVITCHTPQSCSSSDKSKPDVTCHSEGLLGDASESLSFGKSHLSTLVTHLDLGCSGDPHQLRLAIAVVAHLIGFSSPQCDVDGLRNENIRHPCANLHPSTLEIDPNVILLNSPFQFMFLVPWVLSIQLIMHRVSFTCLILFVTRQRSPVPILEIVPCMSELCTLLVSTSTCLRCDGIPLMTSVSCFLSLHLLNVLSHGLWLFCCGR